MAGCRRVAEQEFEAITSAEPRPACVYKPSIRRRGDRITLDLGVQIKRFDGRRIILAPDGTDLVIPSQLVPKPHIVQDIGQAYAWYDEHKTSTITAKELAKRKNITAP